jgi:hypothetical protein
MLLRLRVILVACMVLFPGIAPAKDFTQEFSICIGDICANSGNVNLGCDFAYAHASDTDDAAAKYACTIQNQYNRFFVSRVSSTGGGKCGEIIDRARCAN